MGRRPKFTPTIEEPPESEPVTETIEASSPAPSRQTRPRLSPEARAQIIAGLSRRQSPKLLAQDHGVSIAAVYAIRRKSSPTPSAPTAPAPHQESLLRKRLVNFAVRLLLGQDIEDGERDDLGRLVREEMTKRLAEGI